MPCSGCGGAPTAGTAAPDVMRSAQPTPDEIGQYHLASETPGDSLYTGVFENESVYVVGLGTEREQLFTRKQREEAFSAARNERLTIDHVRACGLARGLMIDLFGA